MRRSTGWIALLVATYAMGISNSVVFSLLSDLQDRYGFSSAGLGWIAGAGFVAGFVVQLVLAPLSDRGHSRRMLVIGLLLAVAGSVMFAAGSSVLWFVVARAVVGASSGVFLPAAQAITASMSTDGVAARMGRLRSVELSGFVTGPLIGGALAGPLGLRWPFLICGLAALGAAGALWRCRLHEPPQTERRQRLAVDLLRLPRVRIGLLLAFGQFAPIGVYDSLWDRYLTDRGASNTMVGLSILFYAIPFVALAGPGGRTADRIGAVRASCIGLAIAAPLTATYGYIAIPWLVVAASVVEGGVQALAQPGVQATIAHAAPHGRASAAQGLAGSVQLAGAAMAAVLAPAAYGAWGAGPVFACAGGVMLLAAAGGAVLDRRAPTTT